MVIDKNGGHKVAAKQMHRGFGVLPNTVRFSAGIEDAEIILEDLKQALDQL